MVCDMVDKNSTKRNTRPLKGHDLTHKCSLRGIQKDHLVQKNWIVWKNLGGGQIFFKGLGLSVASLSQAHSSSLSPSTTLFEVALVGI